MTYEQLVQFSNTWGLVILVVLFVGAVFYALWPSHKDKFDRAARAPLDDDGDLKP